MHIHTGIGQAGQEFTSLLSLSRLVVALVRPARYWAAVEGQEGCCGGGSEWKLRQTGFGNKIAPTTSLLLPSTLHQEHTGPFSSSRPLLAHLVWQIKGTVQGEGRCAVEYLKQISSWLFQRTKQAAHSTILGDTARWSCVLACQLWDRASTRSFQLQICFWALGWCFPAYWWWHTLVTMVTPNTTRSPFPYHCCSLHCSRIVHKPTKGQTDSRIDKQICQQCYFGWTFLCDILTTLGQYVWPHSHVLRLTRSPNTTHKILIHISNIVLARLPSSFNMRYL